ncbi:MAG TPA: LuxR C-terminal-related transcriptional regulator [Nannocystis sp.]
MQLDSTHSSSADTAARGAANSWSKSGPGQPEGEAKETRSMSMVSVLTELVHGYRRPAVILTEHGSILCMNAPAMRALDRKPGDAEPAAPADPKDWPRRATIHTDGQTFTLAIPDAALEAPSAAPEPQLPPRLAKIARLVISGCTDKQIATRTGLSFSTVRTYVRQIYRRIGVHSRVELVHATSPHTMTRGLD